MLYNMVFEHFLKNILLLYKIIQEIYGKIIIKSH